MHVFPQWWKSIRACWEHSINEESHYSGALQLNQTTLKTSLIGHTFTRDVSPHVFIMLSKLPPLAWLGSSYVSGVVCLVPLREKAEGTVSVMKLDKFAPRWHRMSMEDSIALRVSGQCHGSPD